MDCGPACLKMICAYYGKDVSFSFLRAKTGFGKNGVAFQSLADTAEDLQVFAW